MVEIQAAGIGPSVWDARPLAGDRWALEHPREAAQEMRNAKEKTRRAIRSVKAGKPVSLGDVFAGAFTRRMMLNAIDRDFRAELRREHDDD